MNPLCKCPGPGLCERHKVRKTAREYQLCSGTANTSDNGLKYWQAWESGKLGATAPDDPVMEPEGFCPKLDTIRNRRRWVDQTRKLSLRQAIQSMSDTLIDPYKLPLPGTELKRIFSLFQIVDSPTCQCKQHAAEMDRNGPAWCEQNIDSIVDWIAAEAKERRLPTIRTAIKMIVKRAIANSRKDGDLPTLDDPPIEHVAFSDPVRRNLLYHVYPVKENGVWQANLDQLIRHMDLFSGRRVVGIAIDPLRCDPAAAVMDYLRGHVEEFIVVQNLPALREVTTFVPLLRQVMSDDPNEVTFYGHAKGVTHKPGDWTTVHRWASMQYETCLGDWPRVREILEDHAMAGSFRRYGQFDTPGNHRWHYSGAFYWFRNRDVFCRTWRRVDQVFFGAESWPGLMFSKDQVGCIFRDESSDLYNQDYMQQVMVDFVKWKDQRKGCHTG